MNVLRNLTLSFAFYIKIDTFSHFKKNSKNFRKLIFFLKSKKTLNILRKMSISVAFDSKIATFSHFELDSFFWRIHVLFNNSQSLNILRNVSVSVEFYCKVATASQLLHFQDFCSKNPFFYFKKAWSLIFLRTVTISVVSTASLLPLPF